MLLPVITIQQPWVWLILQNQLPALRKDIENRSWPLPQKYIDTPVLLHTSAAPKFNDKLVQQAVTEFQYRGFRNADLAPHNEKLLMSTGQIIGVARFSGSEFNRSFDKPETWESTAHLPSPWCETTAKYWWKITKVKAIKPVPAKGKLSVWKFNYPFPAELEGI